MCAMQLPFQGNSYLLYYLLKENYLFFNYQNNTHPNSCFKLQLQMFLLSSISFSFIVKHFSMSSALCSWCYSRFTKGICFAALFFVNTYFQLKKINSNQKLGKMNILLRYGFYGDVITESEKYRWMGPKRYDYAGTMVFLKHR